MLVLDAGMSWDYLKTEMTSLLILAHEVVVSGRLNMAWGVGELIRVSYCYCEFFTFHFLHSIHILHNYIHVQLILSVFRCQSSAFTPSRQSMRRNHNRNMKLYVT